MAVNTNNPPGRLHDIFRRAKEAGDGPPTFIWSKVFGLEKQDILALTKRLFDVLFLADETEKGFSKFPTLEAEKFLEPIAPIRSVVRSSLGSLRQNQTGLVSPVSDRHLTLLELGADAWSRYLLEPEVDKKSLEEIRKQTGELRETVRQAADVNEDLRSLLLSMLAAIEQALDQFEVIGPAALEKGLIDVLGQSRWAWTHMEKPAETSQGGKLLKKLGAIVISLSAAMTFANTAHKTIETWGPDILMLTSAPEIPPVALPELEGGPDPQKNTPL